MTFRLIPLFVLLLLVFFAPSAFNQTPSTNEASTPAFVSPEINDILYTQRAGQWAKLSLHDVRELFGPALLPDTFPELHLQKTYPRWLLRVITTANAETYLIDVQGNPILMERNYQPQLDRLATQIQALQLALDTPKSSEGTAELSLSKIHGDTLFFSNGSYLLLPEPDEVQAIQELPFDTLYLTVKEGQTIDLSALANEICCRDNQTLQLSGSVLSILGGNSVDLATVPLPFQDPGLSPGKMLESAQCPGLRLYYDYEALRNDPPDKDSLVFIYKPNISGFFYRIPEGNEDGATILKVNVQGGQQYWKRVRTSGYFKLQWWEIGGFIPDSSIEGEISSASDIVNTILEYHPGAVVIDLSSDDGPNTYLLDKTIFLNQNVIFTGAGDTFKRFDTPVALLTNSVGANGSSLEVSDTTGFRKGQTILVTNGRAYDENNGGVRRILQVEANSIKIQGTLGKAMSAGDTVVVVFPMFRRNPSYEEPLERILFQNINFDGNWPRNPYTNDWRMNTTMSFSRVDGSYLIVENAHFRRTPSENIIAGNAFLNRIEADSLGGSLYHISRSFDTTIGVTIQNVRARDVNLATNAVTGHSEALIVSSSAPQNLKVYDVRAFNGKEAFVGDMGGNTDYWEVHDCRVENFKYAVVGNLFGQDAIAKGLRFYRNQFINCGAFWLKGGSLKSKRYIEQGRISDNLFVNTLFRVEGSIGLICENNHFIYQESLGGWSQLNPAEIKENLSSQVYLTEFCDLSFRGNTIEGPLGKNDTLIHAVLFNNLETADMDRSLHYYLGYHLDCSNNTLTNYARGLTFQPILSDPVNYDSFKRSYHDFKFQENAITLSSQTDTISWGIMAGPGVVVQNNQIYADLSGHSQAAYPVFAFGVSLDARSKLVGAIVQNNHIFTAIQSELPTHSIFAGGSLTSNSLSAFNVIVRNNLIPTAVTGNGTQPGHGYIENNLILPSILPELNNWQAPPLLDFGQ